MENITTAPEAVLKALESFDEMKDGYKECDRVLKEVEALGWTFEYGLDAEPYDLKPI